ncbi:hypothetical protein LTSESEN_1405, partial [Salmonella enterica subsp. enterica serovar Senftenberg str. A4-543]
MFCHQGNECFWRIFADICTLQTAGDKIKLLIFQQLANNNPRFM